MILEERVQRLEDVIECLIEALNEVAISPEAVVWLEEKLTTHPTLSRSDSYLGGVE